MMLQDALYPWELTFHLELKKWATLGSGLYQRLLSMPRGRPAFIHRYRSAACSMTIWEAELVAAVERKTTSWFLVGVRLSFPRCITHAPYRGSLPAPESGVSRPYSPSVFALLPFHPEARVADRCTRILEFHSSTNTSEP
jgi:hypothetical protein